MLPADGSFDLSGLLQQAQAMQQQMAQAQQELSAARVSGTAGGGLVTATVSGSGELLALEIEPSAVDPQDTETLADLVVAAVRDATAKAAGLQSDALGPMGETLAGGGLGDLLGGGGAPLDGGRAGLPGSSPASGATG